MIITPSGLDAARIAFDLRFRDAYASTTPLWSRIAQAGSSNTKTTTYPIPARASKLRKWTGERKVTNAKAYTTSISNEKYELTLGIPREDFEDDVLNVYQGTIDDMGQQSALWPDDVVFPTLQAGKTNAAYDGKAFFATNHKLGKNTISNLFTNLPLNPTNYAIVRAAMQTWFGEDDKTLGVTPDLLVVAPQDEAQGRQILQANIIAVAVGGSAAASQTNTYQGTADLLVAPQLANQPGVWYLLKAKDALKALIWQVRQAPEFVQKTQLTDEHVFDQDEFLYGVRARGNAGYGLFWKAARCEPT